MMTSKQLSVQVNGSFMTSPLKGNTDQLPFPVRLHLKNSLIRRDGLVDMFIKIVIGGFLHGMRKNDIFSVLHKLIFIFIMEFKSELPVPVQIHISSHARIPPTIIFVSSSSAFG